MVFMDDEIRSIPQIGERAPSAACVTSNYDEDHDLDFGYTAVPDNKFAFSPAQLHRLVTTRRLSALNRLGGLRGLEIGLRTSLEAGLSVNEHGLDGVVTFEEAVSHHATTPRVGNEPLNAGNGRFSDRKRVFGENRLPDRKSRTFWQLAWLAFNDKLMFLLTASATVSLALGIYQSLSHVDGGARIEWVEGLAILVAVIFIVTATAANDYQKNLKFEKLNKRKEERQVTVIRSGKHTTISVFDVLVGDIMRLEAGDVVPADGVIVESFGIQCDESSATGESDLISKMPSQTKDKVTMQRQQHIDPFVLSGTKVATGFGKYLVTAVGLNSIYGKILMSLRDDAQETPLQQKLGLLAKNIISCGITAGGLFFVVLFIRYLVQLKGFGGSKDKGQEFLNLFILSITVIVIAVPEGLPLVITLALAFATTRMLKDNNLVRLLRSCEVMGNATCVCSDKTGTLTQNKMSVVAGVVGTSQIFDDTRGTVEGLAINRTQSDSLSARQFASLLSLESRNLLKTSAALNSTAFEADSPGTARFVGFSTETAMLNFCRDHLSMGPLSEEKANAEIVQFMPFEATRKLMAVVVKTGSQGYRMLAKGAAEVVVANCTSTLLDLKDGVSTGALDIGMVGKLQTTISDYAKRSLRPLAIAYRDFEKWPPRASSSCDSSNEDIGESEREGLFRDMVLIGAFGIRDPLRLDVIESVRQCQSAGVFVRMVTGDNFLTAKAIASECGIYTPGGLVMDGPTFRHLSPHQLDLAIPRLQVLARSTPDDKLLLVSRLKASKETVAVTGDGTNDALALKAADVGFAMGLSGTEVAKDAASIILMDDNFSSIVKALSWGRTVDDAAKKFLQFQFTINFTAGILTVVSALVGGADSSVFSVVQLLWINLIMDTFAALALATDYPTRDLLKRRPEPRDSPILTPTMWKMVLGQSIYQLVVVFTLEYAGASIFFYQSDLELAQLRTMTFNSYIWIQFFNQTNCRRIDNQFNIFEGVLRNPWFLGVQVVTLAGQVIIILKGGDAFETVSLTGAQWGWSILFGTLSIPLGCLVRLVPDHWLVSVWRQLQKLSSLLLFASPSATGESQGHVETGAALLTEQRQNPAEERYLDIIRVIEEARFSGEPYPYGIEVHPQTSKEDPIFCESLLDGSGPPSQRAECIKYLMV